MNSHACRAQISIPVLYPTEIPKVFAAKMVCLSLVPHNLVRTAFALRSVGLFPFRLVAKIDIHTLQFVIGINNQYQ